MRICPQNAKINSAKYYFFSIVSFIWKNIMYVTHEKDRFYIVSAKINSALINSALINSLKIYNNVLKKPTDCELNNPSFSFDNLSSSSCKRFN